MLDPKEMKKGGFGSFVEKERERQAVRDALPAADALAPGAPDASPAAQPNSPRADKTTARP